MHESTYLIVIVFSIYLYFFPLFPNGLDFNLTTNTKGTATNNDLRIIVLLNSTILDVNSNNATNQLYKSRDKLRINFYSVSNFDEILANTPLGSVSLAY